MYFTYTKETLPKIRDEVSWVEPVYFGSVLFLRALKKYRKMRSAEISMDLGREGGQTCIIPKVRDPAVHKVKS